MTLNMNENLNSPDWRELCKELAEFVARLTKHYYEPAELLVRARAALAQPEPEVVGATDQQLKTFACEWWHKFGFVKDKATCAWGIDEIDPEHFVDFSRDLLARWGRPAPAPAGEAAELVTWLLEEAVQAADCDQPMAAGMLTWAAQVVGRARRPAGAPGSCRGILGSSGAERGGGRMTQQSKQHGGIMSEINWRGLCEELLLRWDVDGCDWKPQHQARWNAAIERVRALLAQPEPEVAGATDGESPLGPFSEHDLRQQWNQQADEFNQWDSLDSSEQLAWAQARAIATDRARYGRPAPAPAEDSTLRDAAQLALTTLEGWSNYDQWVWPISAMEQAKRGTTEALVALKTALSRPAPAPAGEVAEVVADHSAFAAWLAREMPPGTIIGDPHWWAPRIARRAASLLKLHAAPVPLLPEDAQVIEPAKHTILVPAPVPVAVSERPWEREGWCDGEDRCWFGAPRDGAADAGWILRKPSERLSHQTVSLPAHALPLPSVEVEHG